MRSHQSLWCLAILLQQFDVHGFKIRIYSDLEKYAKKYSRNR